MNNEKPLISVIVPVYGVERYLNQCIDSLVSQSYRHLEIILVDDGSPDNCPVICDSWALEDGRIKVIHKENGGLSDARNAGMDVATGDFICFVDSDDYVSSLYIERLLEAIVSEGSDIAICSFSSFNEFGIVGSRLIGEGLIDPAEVFRRSCFPDGWKYVVVWNKMYRRGLWSELRFPKGKINEDEFVFHRLIFASRAISLLNEPLYYYRTRSNSIMGTSFSVNRLDAIEARIDRLQFAEHRIDSKSLNMLVPVLTYEYAHSISLLDLGESAIRIRVDEINTLIEHLVKSNSKLTFISRCRLRLVTRSPSASLLFERISSWLRAHFHRLFEQSNQP